MTGRYVYDYLDELGVYNPDNLNQFQNLLLYSEISRLVDCRPDNSTDSTHTNTEEFSHVEIEKRMKTTPHDDIIGMVIKNMDDSNLNEMDHVVQSRFESQGVNIKKQNKTTSFFSIARLEYLIVLCISR